MRVGMYKGVVMQEWVVEKGDNKYMNNFVMSVGARDVDMLICTT
jgi:hypothetical protein